MRNKNFSSRTLALFAILTAAFVGGGIPVLTKIAVNEIPFFSFTFLRFLIAGIFILPIFLKNIPKITKDFYKVILFSLLLSLNVTLFTLGVSLTTATIAQTLYIFTPIIIAILSALFLAEKFPKQKIVGIAIGFIGAFIIILLPVITKGAPFSGNIIGNLIIFIGTVATAVYAMLSKQFQKTYSPLQISSITIFTSCFVLIFFFLTDVWTHPNWWKSISGISLFGTLYVGFIGTTIYYVLYQYAIKYGSPLIASMLLYLQPASAFVWASLMVGEQLTIGFLIGAALAFIGVYLTLQSRK